MEQLEEIQEISKLANIHYIRQKVPLGLGHAIGCAKRFIGDEPFAVLLGDDILYSPEKPCLKQLIDVYERFNSSVLGLFAGGADGGCIEVRCDFFYKWTN